MVKTMMKLPAVLGDSLAAAVSKQVNRDCMRTITQKLERRGFHPPSKRFGVVKRARISWLRDAGAMLIHSASTKRQCLSLWLFPDHDASWIELADLIVAGQEPELALARLAVTPHAAQRLLQARISIATAAKVRAAALYEQHETFYEQQAASAFEPTGEFASEHGVWRFDGGTLVTVIPFETLDPRVRERHQRGITGSGWMAPR